MNGYDVAKRIREDLQMTEVTLAALTGWNQEGDRRRSKEAGFDHHLVELLAPETLMKLLAELSNAMKGNLRRKKKARLLLPHH